MNLAEAQADWRDWLKSERRLAGHTLIAYEHDVAGFLGFMTTYLGAAPTLEALAKLKPAEFRAWLAERVAPGHGPQLDGAGLLLGALLLPLPRQARPRPQRQHRHHPDAQAAALACPRRSTNATWSELLDTDPSEKEREAWIDLRDAAVLLLLYGAGLRIGEALGLTKAHGRRPARRRPGHARHHRQGQQDPPGAAAAAGARRASSPIATPARG